MKQGIDIWIVCEIHLGMLNSWFYYLFICLFSRLARVFNGLLKIKWHTMWNYYYLFMYLLIWSLTIIALYLYMIFILASWCGSRPATTHLHVCRVPSLLHAVTCFILINLFDLVYISLFFRRSWQQAFWHLVACVSFRQKLFFRQSWLVSIFQSVEMLMLFRF